MCVPHKQPGSACGSSALLLDSAPHTNVEQLTLCRIILRRSGSTGSSGPNLACVGCHNRHLADDRCLAYILIAACVQPSNVLSIESRPFSTDTYEYEEEEFEDPETGQLRVKLNNAIRWRYAQQPDGSVKRESNARFVRWSDGSRQVCFRIDLSR